jgi:TorA maturation chaperone TorD
MSNPPVLPEEEGARADLYGLLARLFYAGPDAALHRQIADADGMADPESPLGRAWAAVQAATLGMSASQATMEYDDLFVGVGRAPVSIYASHYLSETWKENTLVNLRSELLRLGLARQAQAREPEDHLAGLLDVMRHLILRSGNGDVALQEGFFRSYLAPWYRTFASEVQAQPQAAFYRHLSSLLAAFLDIEVECFQMA